jgi:hypothetical protein
MYRNMCLHAIHFLGRHPSTRMKICIQLYGDVMYIMYRFHSGSRVNFLLKMVKFAISLPVSGHIVTLELFPKQNLMWISIA